MVLWTLLSVHVKVMIAYSRCFKIAVCWQEAECVLYISDVFVARVRACILMT
jgi:hypothetical protein